MNARIVVAVLLVLEIAPAPVFAQQADRTGESKARSALRAQKHLSETDARQFIAVAAFVAKQDERGRASLRAVSRAYANANDDKGRQLWLAYVDARAAALPEGFAPRPHVDAVLRMLLESESRELRQLLAPAETERRSDGDGERRSDSTGTPGRVASVDGKRLLAAIRRDAELESRLVAVREQLERIADAAIEAAQLTKHDTAKNAINNVR